MSKKYKFIGDEVESNKVKSYVVEVTNEEHERMRKIPHPVAFSGTVVESENPNVIVGRKGTSYINPYHRMLQTGWPTFVKICQ